MLIHLRVRNLALVEEADIALPAGLSVITGETGAGKSILIGALGLLLGERADTSAVRTGAAACSVEATFQLAHPDGINAVLEEAALPPCEDGLLVLRRTVKAGGGGGATVNDSPVTLPLMKRLGALLVDLHGPHDHQSLLSTAAQLRLLDAYAHTEAEQQAYAACFAERRDLLEQQEALSQDIPDMEAQLDLLTHRVREIEEAALEDGEEETVRAEQQTAGHAQRILELAQLITQAVTEDDASALNTLSPLRRTMEELAALWPAAEGWNERFAEVTDALASLSSEIQREAADVEVDPARLAWLDERLATYERLRRKYGPTLADVFRNLDVARNRLRDITSREERKAEIAKKRSAVEAQMNKTGQTLRKARQKAAGALGQAITAELRTLGFAHGIFSIQLEPAATPQASGLDQIEFSFSANAGEPERPLRQIASSGEISRVMLGIKVVLAKVDQIPLLVFDEIDANVGGETAHAVGRKLAQAGQTHQVIAITHLPAVAACGNAHFAVRKEIHEGRTRTLITALEATARVDEIARMLGGKESTSVVLRHAQELLDAARG